MKTDFFSTIIKNLFKKANTSTHPPKNVYKNICGCFIQDSKILQRVHQQKTGKKEQTSGSCNKMDESQKHYTEWKKPDTN